MYYGKVITAAVIGKRLCHVTCEKCRTPFFYELTRVGKGNASALFNLGLAWARKRAEKSAQRNLAKRLDREAEMVPCPKCHWVNRELIEKYRRRRFRGGWKLILLLFVAALAAAPLIAAALADSSGHNANPVVSVQITVVAMSLTAAVAVWFAQRHFRLRINPNTNFPAMPSVPSGTPPALLETSDPQSGGRQYTAVPSTTPQQAGQNQWATFRPAQVQFPSICCVCLEPATTTYSPPLKSNDHSDLAVPLYRRCKLYLHVKWWVTAFMAASVSAAAGGILALLVPRIDVVGRWMIFSLITFFGSLVGGTMMAGRFSRPYRLRVVDRDRDIINFAADNPGFTAMLVDQAHQSDGFRVN